MMKKLPLLLLLIVNSAWAVDCNYLSNVAKNNKTELDATMLYKADPLVSKRVYFHSAPSKYCKISNKFIISSDNVVSDFSFNNENQDWILATYTDKNNKKTVGWIPEKDLEFSRTLSTGD